MTVSKYVALAIGFFAIFLLILAFKCSGTGDDGDAVYHYLFSHYAFQHPENFLDHWAKPIFVLLSAPFAYFGFTAIKIFNIIVTSITLWLTYRVADELEVPNPWIAPVVLMFSNMYIVNTLSGLTEPLFALWLIYAVYLYIKDQPVASVVWLSFLPFVRSEGLVILCVYFVFLIIQKQWYLVPLLVVGHLFYALVGFFYDGNFWWIFNKMSYATTAHVYGIGTLDSFFTNLKDVIHLNICWIWLIGMVVGLFLTIASLLKIETIRFTRKEVWLVYGIYTAYFIAHTLFWYFCIFASMGLMRVMVGTLPMMGIIINRGINFISVPFGLIHPKGKQIGAIAAVLFCIGSAYNGFNPGTLELNATQNAQNNAISALQKVGYNGSNTLYYTDAPNFCHFAGVDMFDKSKMRFTKGIYTGDLVPKNCVVVWDDLFSASMSGPVSKLMDDNRFRLLGTYSGNDHIFFTEHYVSVFVRDTLNTKAMSNINVLYENDFEKIATPIKATIKGYDSKNCLQLDKTNAFSPDIQSSMESLKGKRRIQVQAQIYLTQLEGQDYEIPKLIFSYESNGKARLWKPINLQLLIPNPKVWTTVTITEVLEAPQSKDEIIKVYFMYAGKEPYYIDNMKIQVGE